MKMNKNSRGSISNKIAAELQDLNLNLFLVEFASLAARVGGST